MSGLANSRDVVGELGGTLLKIDLASGSTVAKYNWQIDPGRTRRPRLLRHGLHAERVSTASGKVYFVGFNAKLYCLKAGDLSLVWVTDLRNRDLAHNQPVQTFDPTDPQSTGGRLVGAAGGERPRLSRHRRGREPEPLTASCSASTPRRGKVVWIFCTNQYVCGPAQPAQSAARQGGARRAGAAWLHRATPARR